MTAISKSDTMIVIVSDETQWFMVGALGDWRLDYAFWQTEGHVQATDQHIIAGLP